MLAITAFLALIKLIVEIVIIYRASTTNNLSLTAIFLSYILTFFLFISIMLPVFSFIIDCFGVEATTSSSSASPLLQQEISM